VATLLVPGQHASQFWVGQPTQLPLGVEPGDPTARCSWCATPMVFVGPDDDGRPRPRLFEASLGSFPVGEPTAVFRPHVAPPSDPAPAEITKSSVQRGQTHKFQSLWRIRHLSATKCGHPPRRNGTYTD
jgi:hypothetical protein